MKRLEQLQGFSKIYAPFDGVITARNTDIGALIGSGSAARELFHIAATDRLRVFVNVPQVYSQAAAHGPRGRRSAARISRDARSRARWRGPPRRSTSRRARCSTEIDVDNPRQRAAAGRVREVAPAAADRRLVVPAAGEHADLPFRGAAGRDRARTASSVLQPSRSAATSAPPSRSSSGLDGQREVVVNPPDALTAGQTVRVASPADQPRSRSREASRRALVLARRC